MPTAVLVALSLLAGACIGVQGAINGVLARQVGSPVTAALISFGAGIVALAVAFGVQVGPSGVSPAWRDLPVSFYVVGGLLGAVYITAAAFLIPRLGVATFLALVIAGQVGAGLVLDHVGAFGLAVQAISSGRLLAAGLIVAGVVLTRLT